MSAAPIIVRPAAAGSLGGFEPKPAVPGQPAASDRSAAIPVAQEGVQAGVWECSPGVFARAVRQAEFVHVVAGHGFFTPDGGAPMELRAGDVAYFPADCRGVWEVRESLRKTYLLLPSA